MLNVLLITIDSLRPDFLGCYGNAEKLSPTIDLLAEEGVLFKSVISQGPRTPESFPALLSGQYTNRHLDQFEKLSGKRTMISEILKDNGYTTAAFHSSPYVSRIKGFDRGFDYFKDNIFIFKKTMKMYWIKKVLTRIKTIFTIPYVLGSVINKQVERWIAENSKPHFLWVHYMDVHGPYISRKGWYLKNRLKAGMLWRISTTYPNRLKEDQKQYLVRCYKEEITHADSCIKELLDHVNLDNTIVILMADHGEFMGEHGFFGHPPYYLYDTLLKIPLIIKFPESMKIGKKNIDRTVRSLDVVPTILDILNIKPEVGMDGESLLPLMKGDMDSYECDVFVSEIWTNHLAIRKDNWKLIYWMKDGVKILRLFDLSKDPKELVNLAEERPDIVRKMEQLIAKHLNNINAPSKDLASLNFETDNEEVKAKLKALGYL
jgi:arylsulfatase